MNEKKKNRSGEHKRKKNKKRSVCMRERAGSGGDIKIKVLLLPETQIDNDSIDRLLLQ